MAEELPYLIHTFDNGDQSHNDNGIVRLVVWRLGDPVLVSFGTAKYALEPRFAKALGNKIAAFADSSIAGEERAKRRLGGAAHKSAAAPEDSRPAADASRSSALRPHWPHSLSGNE
jgi:hypothetical protein